MHSKDFTPNSISLLIPVFNGFEQATACLDSVLRFAPKECEIHVVDDASPSGDFKTHFEKLAQAKSRTHFRRNEFNLGFVKTCNEFFENQKNDDVIILNSDTRVTAGWVENLRKAAYSNPSVGTVTPFSNNATICSLPEFCKENFLAPGISEHDYAEILRCLGTQDYPEIPTCVGFCTYIRRDLLNEIGFFNETAFGRGYGEENDLSRRAVKAGWKNVLDPKTFVFHQGSVSFGNEKDHKPSENEKILNRLHPEYFNVVENFVKTNPLKKIHKDFSDRLLKVWMKHFAGKHVLHFLHNGPHIPWNGPTGGTEEVVKGIIAECKESAHWTLVPTHKNLILTAHLGYFSLSFSLKKNSNALKELFEKDFFSHFHLHHLMGFDLDSLVNEFSWKKPFSISVHDFYWICQRINLVERSGSLCKGNQCLDSCFENPLKIANHRKISERFFKAANDIFYFSDFSKIQIENCINQSSGFNWQKTRHGLPSYFLSSKIQEVRVSPDSQFRVLFLGSHTPTKGFDIFSEAKRIDKKNPKSNLIWLEIGNYKRENLSNEIERLNPHLICLLSRVPETYSLSLDEAIARGIPVLVTPIGSLCERTQQMGAGWILPDFKAETLVETVGKVSKMKSQYQNLRLKLLTDDFVVSEKQANQTYSRVYSQHWDKNAKDQSDFLNFLLTLKSPDCPDHLSFGKSLKQSRFYFFLSRFKVLRKIKNFFQKTKFSS